MLTQENKNKLVNAMLKYQRLDRIHQGFRIGEDEPHGSHIGCCGQVFGLPSGKPYHNKLSQILQIPEWILRLSESIFEGLEEKEAIKFSLDFVKALPVNVNIDKLQPIIEINRLERLIELQKKSTYLKKESVISAIQGCIDLWKTYPFSESAARPVISTVLSKAASTQRSALRLTTSREESDTVSYPTWSASLAAWSARKSLSPNVWSAAGSLRDAVRSAYPAERLEVCSIEAYFLIKTLKNSSK